MSITAPTRCSAVADELDEPMIGTTEHRVRWLLVEDRSAWGEKAVRDVLGADLDRSAKEHGVRLLLVRRREADPAGDVERRVFAIDTERRLARSGTIDDIGALGALVADAAAADRFGEPMTEPLYLVCTNGRRDACCALRGRALMTALAADRPDATWECSHLGGHRFAANLVCLPEGIVYGRVPPGDGPRLAADFASGRLDLDLLRGRAPWPAPAQVADQLLRRRDGLRGLDDVRLRSATVDGDAARVVLATEAGESVVELVAERLAPPRSISCRSDDTEEPRHWRPA